jgi:hypothetical protein
VAALHGVNEKLAVAVAPGDRAVEPAQHLQAECRAGVPQALLDHGVHRLVAHDAALADLAGLQLELRLDQHQQLAAVAPGTEPRPAAPASAR